MIAGLGVALASTAAYGAPEGEGDGAEVEAISLSKIGEEADRTKTRLEEVTTRTERGPSLAEVDRELPDIADRVAVLEEEAASQVVEDLSERELEDLTFAWEQVSRQTKGLQSKLSEEFDRFQSELQRVQTMIDRWEATAASEETTSAAKDQAKEILQAANVVADELRGYLETIHDAQTRVSANSQVIARRLADFAAARERLRGRILSRGDPLWSVDPRRGESPASLVRRTIRQQGHQILFFLSESAGSLIILLLTWAASWWALVMLARASDDRGTKMTLGIESSLRRPKSAALVFAIGLFALLGPPMPWALRQAMWLLTLPALLRLLALTPYRPIAIAFAGPLLLSLVSETVPESSAWSRYVHLLVSVSGLVAALRVGRYRRSEGLTGLGLRGVRLAEVLLALSIGANVIGYGALAPVVNHATMFGLFLAVLILAWVGVCRALVRMSLKTQAFRKANAVRHHGERLTEQIQRYVVIGAWIIWVAAAAEGFGIAEPAWRSVQLWLEDPWEVGAFAVTPGDLLAFGLTLYAALLTSRLIGFVLEEDVLPRLSLGRGLPPTISMLVRYLILAVGFIVATVAAGVQLDKLSLLVGAFGVGIGFGLQNVVNNFVSGLVLMFERPVKVGDVIEIGIGQLFGEVTRIGIRASTVRTIEGAEVIVPNANLISNEVINWTLSDRRRRFHVAVGVKYGTDPKKVISILEEVANDNRRVLGFPKPTAHFMGFGESSLDFHLLVWTSEADDWRGVRSEVTVAVNDAIVAAGIEIPFPQRDLHVRSVEGGLIERARGESPSPLRGGGPPITGKSPALDGPTSPLDPKGDAKAKAKSLPKPR